MPLAVADTGPVHYLVLIGAIDLLPKLFGQVLTPEAVQAELLHPEAPVVVRGWVAAAPAWFRVLPTPADGDLDFRTLDEGERAAIALASSLRPDIILMDDRAGVAAARSKGFAVTGTLGVLDRAARRGLIDLQAAFATLRATNFHARQDLLDRLLAQDRERRGRS
jgi:predicted nucleic acid-binding protein